MRITSQMIFNELARSLRGNLEEFAKLNSRLSTGKKIDKPSDDVIGALRAMSYKVSINSNGQYKRNIDQANIHLDFTNTVMDSVSDSLLKLSELTSMANNPQDNQQLYAQQAANLRDYFLDLSNSKLENAHVFSGYSTDQQAFVYNSSTNMYDYQGDSGEIRILLDKEATIARNVQGSKAFSFSLNPPIPTALSDGTPVAYTQTTDPATGVTSVTVEIGNAGDPDYDTFAFSNYMDMANVLSSAWQYKNIDGSDLSADPATGEEMAMHRIAALAKPLSDARTQALGVQAEVGTRQVLLKDQADRIAKNNLGLENALADIEDADMNETVMGILKTQTALDALRESASRILSQSLLDFLK